MLIFGICLVVLPCAVLLADVWMFAFLEQELGA